MGYALSIMIVFGTLYYLLFLVPIVFCIKISIILWLIEYFDTLFCIICCRVLPRCYGMVINSWACIDDIIDLDRSITGI